MVITVVHRNLIRPSRYTPSKYLPPTLHLYMTKPSRLYHKRLSVRRPLQDHLRPSDQIAYHGQTSMHVRIPSMPSAGEHTEEDQNRGSEWVRE